jgi:hypothetical protein
MAGMARQCWGLHALIEGLMTSPPAILSSPVLIVVVLMVGCPSNSCAERVL